MKAFMYHYVRPDDPSMPYFRHLRLNDFRRQLDYLQSRWRLLSRDELAGCLREGAPAADGVVLTFDDGFKDHYRHVFPELKKRGITGIFYVPTDPFATGRLLDVHRVHLLLGAFGGETILTSLLKRVDEAMLSHQHVREFREETYRCQTNDEFTTRVKRTLNYFIDYSVRPRILDALMAEFFGDEQALAREFYVNEEELGEMQECGMIIGSHTVTHPCMSKLSMADQQWEIEESFRFLERILGSGNLKTFCYPYGGSHSFTRETERLLDQAGCDFSFSVDRRDIEPADLQSRRQALPRYDCNTLPAAAEPLAL